MLPFKKNLNIRFYKNINLKVKKKIKKAHNFRDN